MGTTVASFQLAGWWPDRRTEVKIELRQVGWAGCRAFRREALTWSWPEAEEGGARERAEETSGGKIGGISGVATGWILEAGPARW